MNNYVSTTFSQKLNRLRKKHGISIKKLSNDLWMDESFIRELETGYRGCADAELKQLCDYFQVKTDYFAEDRFEQLSLL